MNSVTPPSIARTSRPAILGRLLLMVILAWLVGIHASTAFGNPAPANTQDPKQPTVAGDESWSDKFSLPGTNDEIRTIAVMGSDVYVGGLFTVAGTEQAGYIARWDGSNWHPAGVGMNGAVYALTVHNGQLYAGGAFTTAGGSSANHVARWDGSNWHPLGSGPDNGVNNTVYSLATSAGGLYVGGWFTGAGGSSASHIVRWDGSTWDTLDGGVDNYVFSMLTIGSDLYVGGSFTVAGTTGTSEAIVAYGIARWDGSSWHDLASGTDEQFSGGVGSLTIYNNQLHAGGNFIIDGASAAHSVARWDGNQWHALGTGLWCTGVPACVTSLAVFRNELYAGGYISGQDEPDTSHLTRWNGISWQRMAGDSNRTIRSTVTGHGSLYVGGEFGNLGGIGASGIARWDGSTWHALSNARSNGLIGISNSSLIGVHALAVAGGSVYAGGTFLAAGDVKANGIARWDGSQWHSLGTGENNGVNGTVFAIAVSGNKVYVGGSFTKAGTQDVRGLAVWDGNGWSTLGGSLDDNGYVFDILLLGDHVYIGGWFGSVGGVQSSAIAHWDGNQWLAMGSGANDYVRAIALMGSDIYAAGDFSYMDNTYMRRIARWDGNQWHPIISGSTNGIGSFVTDLEVSGSNLYATGVFTRAGEVLANSIARWDGSQWHPLGSGMNHMVNTVAIMGSDVYAGGWFDLAGGAPASRVARWDGSQWHPLGSGILGVAEALVYDSAGDLYVAGSFSQAGGKPAYNLSKWNASSDCEISFSDMPPDAVYYAPVQCLACRGIVSGYGDSTFGPNNPITRGQIAKVVSNVLGYNWTPQSQTFADVPPGSTFYEYVERISSNQIVGGYLCGGPGEPCDSAGRPYYRPSNNTTRGQFAKIATIARGYTDNIPVDRQTFIDVPTSHTFWLHIERAAQHGLISGYTCGAVSEPCPGAYFRPQNNITRGQTAKIITNAFFPECSGAE